MQEILFLIHIKSINRRSSSHDVFMELFETEENVLNITTKLLKHDFIKFIEKGNSHISELETYVTCYYFDDITYADSENTISIKKMQDKVDFYTSMGFKDRHADLSNDVRQLIQIDLKKVELLVIKIKKQLKNTGYFNNNDFKKLFYFFEEELTNCNLPEQKNWSEINFITKTIIAQKKEGKIQLREVKEFIELVNSSLVRAR